MLTRAHWIEDGVDSSFGWLTSADGCASDSGVLVLGAVGYAWWSSHETLRRLAERLATEGHTVLRLHYPGSGDAPGAQTDSDRPGAWRRSITRAAAELRELGVRELCLVGVGLGGSLALELAADLRAGAVAAWAPVIDGRREARSLKLRSTEIPDDDPGPMSFSFAGTVLTAQTLDAIAAIDLGAAPAPPARVLLLGPGSEAYSEYLAAAGTDVHRADPADGEQALSMPAEDAVPAFGVVEAVADWLGPAPTGRLPGTPLATSRSRLTFDWREGRVREEAVALGPTRLVGIMTSPASAQTLPGTVVLLNSGSEPHVGAGRAWVELARDLALRGRRALRVNWRGWGESPDDGYAPGRPYDAHAIADTLVIARALEVRGQAPIVLVGLCAGAWVALRAVLDHPVAAVIALNPQMYWQPGDPVEALMSDTRVRRAPERAIEEEGRVSGRWDELDAAGERNPAGAWLDALAASPAQISLLFAEGDDGLEYLHNRLDRRLGEVTQSGAIRVAEVAEIDHPMHRTWLRPRMFAAISDALDGALGAADPELLSPRGPGA